MCMKSEAEAPETDVAKEEGESPPATVPEASESPVTTPPADTQPEEVPASSPPAETATVSDSKVSSDVTQNIVINIILIVSSYPSMVRVSSFSSQHHQHCLRHHHYQLPSGLKT